MYFTDKKCQIFNSVTYDKVIHYCQIDVELMPKLGVTAKIGNLMLNSKNNANLLNKNLFSLKFII